MDDFFHSARNYLRFGVWGALVLSILLSALLYFLQKTSFICFDPKYCANLDRPMIEVP